MFWFFQSTFNSIRRGLMVFVSFRLRLLFCYCFRAPLPGLVTIHPFISSLQLAHGHGHLLEGGTCEASGRTTQ